MIKVKGLFRECMGGEWPYFNNFNGIYFDFKESITLFEYGNLLTLLETIGGCWSLNQSHRVFVKDYLEGRPVK